MGFRTAACWAVAAAALGLARPAGATVVRAVDFPEQCADAERIVVATVRDVTSRPVAAAPTYFETLVTLGVDDTVAGAPGSALTIRLSGGQVGDIRQSIDGMPEFAVGERYVLFLEPDQTPPLVSPIVGFNQGLYRVDRVGDRDVVRDRNGRPLSGSAAAASAAVAASRAPAGPAADAVAVGAPSLDDFLAAVRAARR